MREIRTSGLMSGDGRRGNAEWPSYRAHPRLYRRGHTGDCRRTKQSGGRIGPHRKNQAFASAKAYAELPAAAFARFDKGAEVMLHLGGATQYPDEQASPAQAAA
jgi:hypothetical protein